MEKEFALDRLGTPPLGEGDANAVPARAPRALTRAELERTTKGYVSVSAQRRAAAIHDTFGPSTTQTQLTDPST